MEEKKNTDVYSALTDKMEVLVNRRTRLKTGIRMHTEHKSYLFTRSLEHRLKASQSQEAREPNPHKPKSHEEMELLNFTSLCYDDGPEYDLGVFRGEAWQVLERENMFRRDKFHLPDVLQLGVVRAFARQVPLGRTVDLSCRPCDEHVEVDHEALEDEVEKYLNQTDERFKQRMRDGHNSLESMEIRLEEYLNETYSDNEYKYPLFREMINELRSEQNPQRRRNIATAIWVTTNTTQVNISQFLKPKPTPPRIWFRLDWTSDTLDTLLQAASDPKVLIPSAIVLTAIFVMANFIPVN